MVLEPELDDSPDDLEDAIHDWVVASREQAKPPVVLAVLDLSGLENPSVWMKAVGPQIPDVNLRIALGERGFAVARALKLDALFDWYSDVERALRAHL